jgi:hypothetical protein
VKCACTEGMFRYMCVCSDVSSNELAYIAPSAWSATPVLTSISLEYNRIAGLGANTFASLHQLTKLNVSHNLLRTLGNNSFDNCCVKLEIL